MSAELSAELLQRSRQVDYRVSPASRLRGEVPPPGDKSISHRAVMLNAMAKGPALITNFLAGTDTLATIDCLQALGATISLEKSRQDWSENKGATVHVAGQGIESLVEAQRVLDAKNSGTTMRLLTGLLSAVPMFTVITGDSSLRRRPMARVIRPLSLMGAKIWGRRGNEYAPLAINGGHLKGIEYSLPVPSAQLKSALILAGLLAEGQTVIHQPLPSRDHTERMVQAMQGALAVTGDSITVSPSQLRPIDVRVPGDISSAAFWLVAASIHPDAKVKIIDAGINPTRIGVLDILTRMGAKIEIENCRTSSGEPMADITIQTSQLEGVEIGDEDIPRVIDELPLVALAATQARGKTIIKDAEELRIKESDRIRTTAQELSKLGAKIEELPNGLVIQGPSDLKGAECDSHGDHRLAMTLGIAGLIAQSETTVKRGAVVEVSYPGFWADLEMLKGRA